MFLNCKYEQTNSNPKYPKSQLTNPTDMFYVVLFLPKETITGCWRDDVTGEKKEEFKLKCLVRLIIRTFADGAFLCYIIIHRISSTHQISSLTMLSSEEAIMLANFFSIFFIFISHESWGQTVPLHPGMTVHLGKDSPDVTATFKLSLWQIKRRLYGFKSV